MVHMGNVKLVTPLAEAFVTMRLSCFINNLGKESLYKLIYQILEPLAFQLQTKEMIYFSFMSLCKTSEPQFRTII